MSWFFFTWNGDKRETWQTYLAEQRQEVCDEAKPQYVTILDCNHSFKEGVEEPVGGVKYRGPLDLDWDGKDGIPDVLDAVRVFMSRLEERYMFDLEQAQWFLSGGRGVHCTIPPECFLDNKTINAGVVV